ncbi:hypothetical protein HFP15_39115 [Amycolatopsis sp. K13G38]|uniref:Uncharacterized protein n=1 Tax=Amycolatopsis acididurans TaxID=2724524 RepID=A0ABX1JI25_9PSEU|nr:hypothetical protein [Amycolatopsis acididurans]NKQ58871.1 hypothetical protein [Amycolatopsis acididurans]
MGAGWLTGDVRGRALLTRRLGTEGARRLAASPSADAAIATLSAGPYGRSVRTGQSIAEAEHAVAATTLWHLRVLAGWQPREGSGLVRHLSGWFEIANVVEHARALAGQEPGGLFELGRLATAWARVAESGSPPALRAALTATPWEDPGEGTPAAVAVSMALSWASRVQAAVPEAGEWAAGGAALVVARQRFALGAELAEPVARRAVTMLGQHAGDGAWDAFVTGLRTSARWALADVAGPGELWRAENRWWARVSRDATVLVSRPRPGRAALLGVVAFLAIDAWRVRAALQVAARGGQALEMFDELG